MIITDDLKDGSILTKPEEISPNRPLSVQRSATTPANKPEEIGSEIDTGYDKELEASKIPYRRHSVNEGSTQDTMETNMITTNPSKQAHESVQIKEIMNQSEKIEQQSFVQEEMETPVKTRSLSMNYVASSVSSSFVDSSSYSIFSALRATASLATKPAAGITPSTTAENIASRKAYKKDNSFNIPPTPADEISASPHVAMTKHEAKAAATNKNSHLPPPPPPPLNQRVNEEEKELIRPPEVPESQDESTQQSKKKFSLFRPLFSAIRAVVKPKSHGSKRRGSCPNYTTSSSDLDDISISRMGSMGSTAGQAASSPSTPSYTGSHSDNSPKPLKIGTLQQSNQKPFSRSNSCSSMGSITDAEVTAENMILRVRNLLEDEEEEHLVKTVSNKPSRTVPAAEASIISLLSNRECVSDKADKSSAYSIGSESSIHSKNVNKSNPYRGR
eukprot:CAMPEP_0182440450 /NCGR_PEP_ID=MMETSP1167-20130531/87076_1 /TAXON_ID=2988 /ORGANISM="Mallomonas Sp, Strain CCMP3275" /LENGTH=444 /DNA_ID=CAMNT_0024634415 /DNA_START=1080 /DNA_END=2414 /DNA_ORIENTATION=-